MVLDAGARTVGPGVSEDLFGAQTVRIYHDAARAATAQPLQRFTGAPDGHDGLSRLTEQVGEIEVL